MSTEEQQERIIIPDENGEEHLFEILLNFDVHATESSYLALIPAEQKEDEEVEVYVFRYEDEGDGEDDLKLFQIETDDEWEIVEETMQTLLDEDL